MRVGISVEAVVTGVLAAEKAVKNSGFLGAATVSREIQGFAAAAGAIGTAGKSSAEGSDNGQTAIAVAGEVVDIIAAVTAGGGCRPVDRCRGGLRSRDTRD